MRCLAIAATVILCVAGCKSPTRARVPYAVDIDLADAGSYGPELAQRPGFDAAPGQRRTLRPTATTAFAADYRRIRIARGKGGLQATLWAGRAERGTAFTYPCPQASDIGALSLRWWAFTTPRSVASVPHTFELRAGNERIKITLPGAPGVLRLFEVPLPDASCAGPSPLRVAVDPTGSVGLAAAWMSPPQLVVEAAHPAPPHPASPPVILISVDTLRADAWDHDQPARRPASLRRFYGAAWRLRHIYASAPTTHPSHRVIFSGLRVEEARNNPVTGDISFVPALRAAGYTTLAFVAGGYIRAPFGFGFGLAPTERRRSPGFALGFDLYLEGMDTDPRTIELRGLPALAMEKALNTHTLGPALERSLRWFQRYPNAPTFHFLHGYDVHESRSVRRRFWDAAVAARPNERAAIDHCVEQLGAVMDDEIFVHYPYTKSQRNRPLGRLEGCHRRIAKLVYEARVRSVETMLGEYFDGLRELGVYDRALIVLTTDHGESLLDEKWRHGRNFWGHNRLLHNNLHVPLWIKPPGATSGGDIDELGGLIDLRATLGAILGRDVGRGRGVSLLDPATHRPGPLELVHLAGERGVLLGFAEICSWKTSDAPQGKPGELRFYDGTWHGATPVQRLRCVAARAGLPAPPPGASPRIPEKLTEELKALGYVE